MFGKFNIVKPYITCQTFDEKMLGLHFLVFKTVAECNQNYLQQIGVPKFSLGDYTNADTCIYTVYLDVNFWKTGKIYLLPILITFLVFGAIALTVIALWVVKKIVLKRMQRELAEYTALGGTNIEEDKHK